MTKLENLGADTRRDYVGTFKRQIRFERQQGNMLIDSPIEVRAFVARFFSFDISIDTASQICRDIGLMPVAGV